MQAYMVGGKMLVRGGKLAVDPRSCCVYEAFISGGHSFAAGGNSEHPYCEEYIRDWRPGDANCTVTQNDSQLSTWQGQPVIPAWQGAASQSSMEVILRDKATGVLAFSAHTSDNGNPGALPSITWNYPADFDGVCHNLVADWWNGCTRGTPTNTGVCEGNPLP